MNEKIINVIVRKAIDSNNNCCFNCTHFKLKWDKENSIVPQNILQYRHMKARCTNPLAIHEDICRENPVRLQTLLNKGKVPKIRENCNFFELG